MTKNKKLNIYKRDFRFAFTLVEILITLVIIGIVAAITVPTIVANSNEKAIKSALRKNVSVIQQAVQKYYSDNNEYPSAANYLGEGKIQVNMGPISNFFRDGKYFNISKKCRYKECSYGENVQYKDYSGKTEAFAYNPIKSEYGVMLMDGTYINFSSVGARTSADGVVVYTVFIVDVNGAKNPNRLGKDTFLIELGDNGKIILGGDKRSGYSEEDYCNAEKPSPTNGYGCTAKMLREN